jgi:hypothetical protein
MKNSQNRNKNQQTTPTTVEIEALLIEFNRLNDRFNEVTEALQEAGRLDGEGRVIDRTKQGQQAQRNTERQLSIGDRVKVLNNYRGRQGITGVITRITPTQAHIRPDNGGNIFRSYKQNLRRINRRTNNDE